MKKKIGGVVLLLILLISGLNAQAYIDDLKNGDLDKVERKLSILGSSMSKEPVLSRYLDIFGADPGIVKELISRGADLNMAPASFGRTPLNVAVESRQSTEIISILLEAGASIESPFTVYNGIDIINFALGKMYYSNAAVLLKYNQTLEYSKRIIIGDRHKMEAAILLDDIEAAKDIISKNAMWESSLWELAVYGESRKILELLSVLYDSPDIKDETLTIISSNPELMKYMLSLDIPLLSNASSYKIEDIWNKCLEYNDDDLILSLLKVNPYVPVNILDWAVTNNPSLFIKLADNGLLVENTEDLWNSALKNETSSVFPTLLKLGEVPKNLIQKSLDYGDSLVLSLLSSGFNISSEDIPWNRLVTGGFEQSIFYLNKSGFPIPGDLVLVSLAYNEKIFLSALNKESEITRESLGNEVVVLKRGDNPRLIVDVAIEKGFLSAIKKIDEYFSIFDLKPSYKNPEKYTGSRGRDLLDYYDVRRKGSKRGYAMDGYNDFLTNNFNVLMFLIAVKNNQVEIASYILGRDETIPEESIFSSNESIGEFQYKYTVKEFVKKFYSRSPCVSLVE